MLAPPFDAQLMYHPIPPASNDGWIIPTRAGEKGTGVRQPARRNAYDGRLANQGTRGWAALTRRRDTEDWIDAMPGTLVKTPVRNVSYSFRSRARMRSK